MKAIVLALLILSSCHAPSPDVGTPPKVVTSHEVAASPEVAEDWQSQVLGEIVPKPSIDFLRFEESGNGQESYAVFELVNRTQKKFSYQAEYGQPVASMIDLGKPERWGLSGRCGTAFTTETLSSGERVRFRVFLYRAVGPIRAKVYVRLGSRKQVAVLSPQVDLAERDALSFD